MAHLLPLPKLRFFDSSGAPLAGGKLYSYAAGTSTLQATYTDSAGGVANANPVILDANGEASVWLGTASYKFVLKDSNDVTQWTVDGVSHIADGAVITDKLADGVLSADVPGRLKMADGFVNPAKLETAAVTTPKIADLAVTRGKLEALGHQVSSSCGSFTTTSPSTTPVSVTNLSVTITTSGRPVVLCVVADESHLTDSNSIFLGSDGASISSLSAFFSFHRGSTEVARFLFQNNFPSASTSITSVYPPGSLFTIDRAPAGTHTYTVKACRGGSPGTGILVALLHCKLMAYEL